MTRRPIKAMPALIAAIAAIFLLTVLLLANAGCGSKAGISQSQHDQLQKGMTLDQVEGILGQPDRSHRTGPANNPSIIWYYNKSEAEGLVRIAFEDGKMTTISPYDLSVNLDE